MNPIPNKAFLMAAGLGTRLRPYTDTMPKPMVPVAGKPIIGHALEKLADIGVKDAWINLHYLPDVIKHTLNAPNSIKIHYSYEEKLLNTGGGVKKCLKEIGNDPFFMINGDALWEDGAENTLVRLNNTWDSSKFDLLLLLQPVDRMTLTQGFGDYDIIEGHAVRNKNKQGQYMFTGIRLTHAKLFDLQGSEPDDFSFLVLMDEAEKRGRLGHVVHDGDWHHISTPQDLEAVDAHMRHRA